MPYFIHYNLYSPQKSGMQVAPEEETQSNGGQSPMNKQELLKKIAQLEFANDQLTSEIAYIDQLMRLVGFTDGLESLKATALELYDGQHEDEEFPNAA
jgi:hypothetical protein